MEQRRERAVLQMIGPKAVLLSIFALTVTLGEVINPGNTHYCNASRPIELVVMQYAGVEEGSRKMYEVAIRQGLHRAASTLQLNCNITLKVIEFSNQQRMVKSAFTTLDQNYGGASLGMYPPWVIGFVGANYAAYTGTLTDITRTYDRYPVQ